MNLKNLNTRTCQSVSFHFICHNGNFYSLAWETNSMPSSINLIEWNLIDRECVRVKMKWNERRMKNEWMNKKKECAERKLATERKCKLQSQRDRRNAHFSIAITSQGNFEKTLILITNSKRHVNRIQVKLKHKR